LVSISFNPNFPHRWWGGLKVEASLWVVIEVKCALVWDFHGTPLSTHFEVSWRDGVLGFTKFEIQRERCMKTNMGKKIRTCSFLKLPKSFFRYMFSDNRFPKQYFRTQEMEK